jgi:two-component system sensor histidine kinase RpfC
MAASGPASPGRGILTGLRFLKARLRDRPDNEHEMVLNRLVIAVLILAYLSITSFLHPGSAHEPLIVSAVFAAAAAGFFAHIIARPGVSVIRRVAAMMLDLSALSYGMHVGEGVTAVLYPMYLWTIFGNGFRFGIPYLRAASAVSVVGFSAVIYTTAYWRLNLPLGIGLLIGLVVLPLYAGMLIRKLSDAKRQAEEASRSKSLFLASISHELRTPLNAVIGMSDLLTETQLDAEQRDMAGTVRTSARALLGLIEELLNFSRLEAGRMPVEYVDFDLHQALAEVRSMVEPQAREKGLALGLHVTPRTPYRVHGDRRHIQEILLNLLGNAVKFTASGSVVINADAPDETRPDRVRFQVVDTGIGIRAEAIDRIFESFTQADETVLNRFGGTGLGLAICKQLAEILGGAIGVQSEYGTGSTFWLELDLAPSQQSMVEQATIAPPVLLISDDGKLLASLDAALAGTATSLDSTGSIEAARLLLDAGVAGADRTLVLVDGRLPDWENFTKSLACEGRPRFSAVMLVEDTAEGLLAPHLQSTFIAGLGRRLDPVALHAVVHLAASRSHSAPTITDAIAQGSGRTLSILVAEDNTVNQKVITKILEKAGHSVRVAPNGEDAVDLLLSDRFDLVLMDVNMPVMSGIEATKLYRFAALGRERVPIVALTADATPDARERCLEAGMDACLSKPIETVELFRVIHELTTRAPQAGDGAIADETVTDIAAHPRFRVDIRSALDSRTLRELEALGGREFVVELSSEFIEEGVRILEQIGSAVVAGDVLAFHDRLHALRSGAANLGALGLYDICLGLRAISDSDFLANGNEQLGRVRAEFARVEQALRDYREGDRETRSTAEPAKISRLPRKVPG